MSAHKIVTFKISCELTVADDCAKVYEGLSSQPLNHVREDAANEGWVRTRSPLTGNKTLDACPKCVERLQP